MDIIRGIRKSRARLSHKPKTLLRRARGSDCKDNMETGSGGREKMEGPFFFK